MFYYSVDDTTPLAYCRHTQPITARTTNQSNMKSKETLTRLTALAEQEMYSGGTRDDKMIQIIWAAEENAGDNGLTLDDPKFAGFVLSSMQDLLSGRENADAAAWYAKHGFIA